MTIGFFDFDLEFLSSFKRAAKEFPSHDYVFYADTQHKKVSEMTAEEIKASYDEAITFLKNNKSESIVFGSTVPQELAEKEIPDMKVVKVTELLKYLEEQPETPSSAKGKTRIVHLTFHSKETDETVKRILGGIFMDAYNG